MVVLVFFFVRGQQRQKIKFECLTSSILNSFFAITLQKIELPSSNLQVDSRQIVLQHIFRFVFEILKIIGTFR